MDEEKPVIDLDQAEALILGSLANKDIPDNIEGLVKRGKKLDAVINWKQRMGLPKLAGQEDSQETQEGDLSKELRMNQYGKGYRPEQSLEPFDEILKHHKILAL